MSEAAVSATWLDRAIGWVSPAAGLRRAHARDLLQRAHQAANPRNIPPPRGAGASADLDVMTDAVALRQHARHLRDNVGYIAAGLAERVDSAIGTGVVRKWTGPHAAKLEKLHKQWSKKCDAGGKLSLGGIEALAMSSMECDGTVLLRVRPRLPEDGLAVPVQLQVLESDWIDMHRQSPSVPGNTVINGAEYDRLGRRVGWWLYDEHPGHAGLPGRWPMLQSTLVPADRLIDLYDVARPGAGQGFSRMKAAIIAIRDLELYREAESRRKDTEARFGVLASGDVSAMAEQPRSQMFSGTTRSLGEIPSGGVLQIPSSLNISTVAPNIPAGYVGTVKYEIMLICAALGCTYEGATGDMTEVNFSSGRIRRLIFRQSIERTQWLTLVPQLLQPLDQVFVQYAKLAGLIPPSATWDVEYTFPRWPAVDVAKEAAADLIEVSSGMASLSSKIRDRGNDPGTVRAEWVQDMRALKEEGLLGVVLALLKGLPMPDETGDGQAPAPAGKARP